jgi:predicted NAD/FAD-binding protein
MPTRGPPRQKVAVIGSGMAGLVTAYLLRTDPSGRFEVEVFETVGTYYSLLSTGF